MCKRIMILFLARSGDCGVTEREGESCGEAWTRSNRPAPVRSIAKVPGSGVGVANTARLAPTARSFRPSLYVLPPMFEVKLMSLLKLVLGSTHDRVVDPPPSRFRAFQTPRLVRMKSANSVTVNPWLLSLALLSTVRRKSVLLSWLSPWRIARRDGCWRTRNCCWNSRCHR